MKAKDAKITIRKVAGRQQGECLNVYSFLTPTRVLLEIWNETYNSNSLDPLLSFRVRGAGYAKYTI